MDPLVARIRRTMRRHLLAPAGTRVLVAVSGGADSMVLLHALGQLEPEGDWRVVGIAHLNHGLREAAGEDEAFCRRAAERLGLRFECERADVRALAADRKWSIEAAGHTARYEFFERAAARLGADRVALGHTRDDQAETFLLRLVRGAGPRGLSAMRPQNGIVIRPMLDCSRPEVRGYASLHAVEFRDDATNDDLTIPRNLVRHEVIPSLARLSPGVVRALGRAAAIARDDAEFLDRAAAAASARIASESTDEVRLDAAELRREPPAIARRVVAAAVARFAQGRSVVFEHVERVLDLVHDARPGPRHAYLPGQIATCTADLVVLRREKEATGLSDGTNFRFLLSIPGEVVSRTGWVLSAERMSWPPGSAVPGRHSPEGESSRVFAFPTADSAGHGTWCAVLDAATIQGPLVVRSWAPGDRFRPLGMTGRRKLQDLFVDRKVQRSARSRVPIVTDAADRILWVAGHLMAEEFRVTPATSDVVILKLKYWSTGT